MVNEGDKPLLLNAGLPVVGELVKQDIVTVQDPPTPYLHTMDAAPWSPSRRRTGAPAGTWTTRPSTSYPLPKIQQLVERAGSHRVYSMLDEVSVYYTISIEEKSNPCTTFTPKIQQSDLAQDSRNNGVDPQEGHLAGPVEEV